MIIGFCDNSGSLLSVAWHCQSEGHEVLYWTKEEDGKQIGVGLVPKVKTLKELIDAKPDAIITYRLDDESSRIRRAGIDTFGSTDSTIELEDKRLFAAQLCRSLGVGKVPRTQRFTDVREARKFVEEDKSRTPWVFKAEGGGAPTSSTHVTESREHLLQILDFEGTLNRAKAFILQEKVDGIEISIEGWFDHRNDVGWIKPINSTLERKKLFAGDIGPMTGCMGSVVWGWPGDRPKLFRQTLENLEPYLRKIKYVGPIDGNFIIDYSNRQPYFLEFTPRFGWNALEAIMAGFRGDFGEFLVNFAKGRGGAMRFKDTYMAALRVYTPHAENVPINAPIREHPNIYPKDLWQDDDGQLRAVDEQTIPGFTAVLEVCGYGRTISQAVDPIYEDIIPLLQVTDIAYRNDIGSKAKEDIRLLGEWGYVVDRDTKPTVSAQRAVRGETVSVSTSEGSGGGPEANQDTPPSVTDGAGHGSGDR